MTYSAASSKTDERPRDREVILIDYRQDKLGIAASLRQAFADAGTEPSDHNFKKLLEELN